MSHGPAAYASLEDRFWYFMSRGVCYAVLVFLVLPILIIVPMSFTSGDLLAFPLPGFSLRWYQSMLQGDAWIDAAKNSLFIGLSSTAWRWCWARWPQSDCGA